MRHVWPARFGRSIGGKDNAVSMVESAGTLRIEFAIYNSDKRTLAPAINGVYEFQAIDSTVKFTPVQNDKYPAYEAYQYLADGSTRELGLHEPTSCGVVLGLSPFC